MSPAEDTPRAVDGSGPDESSSGPVAVPREDEPSFAAEPMTSLLPPEFRAEAIRVVQRLQGWSGPLPPASELVEYDGAVPGTAAIIVEDFRRRSEADLAASQFEQSSYLRDLDYADREQQLRFRESAADIEARRFVLRFAVLFLSLLVGLGFVAAMWGPFESDGGRVFIATVFLAPILLLAGIVLLRGRITDNERDVYKKVLPELAKRPNAPVSPHPNPQGDRTLPESLPPTP